MTDSRPPPARIALLLHMHQPDYRDPRTGRPGMPWVRLHAVRGYTDVATVIAETDAPITVNVAPSLLEQLAAYAAGATDRWEELSRTPPEALRPEDAAFVRARFVHGNPTMRSQSQRYRWLAANAPALSAPGDLRDLMVWSNLAWMGFTARRSPEIRALIEQDRDYSQAQLTALMDHQRALVAAVLPRWRSLPHVSCSPRCHPILPLLIDLEHARRSLPHLPADLGARFAAPEDALRQLVEGRAIVAEHLGQAPTGLWPSEGSVSPEALALAAEAGFAWVAADQGVLQRSRRDGPAAVHHPWRLSQGGPAMLFRDRDLSDRVGFHYHQVPGWRAAEDLIEGARRAAGPGGAGVVPVILDGENPWEAYPDAGEGFLYALARSGALVAMSEAAARPAGRIDALHTGSWINADLQIWAGTAEDRVAWAALAEARAAWVSAGRPDHAWPALAAAEGSDWFWWYGPEFQTPFADFFDATFRGHLRAVYLACGLAPPEALEHPLQRRAPGTARFALGGGAMAQAATPVLGGEVIRVEGGLTLRLDLPYPRPDLAGAMDPVLEVRVAGRGSLRWPWSGGAPAPQALPLSPDAPRRAAPAQKGTEEVFGGSARVQAGDTWVEFGIAWPELEGPVALAFALRSGERVLWKNPDMGWIEVDLG